jgi:hypothetical protein
VTELLSTSAIYESMLCPICDAKGTIPPGWFNRQDCVLQLKEKNNTRSKKYMLACAYYWRLYSNFYVDAAFLFVWFSFLFFWFSNNTLLTADIF